MLAIAHPASPALVVKTDPRTGEDERYLVMTPLGHARWVEDPTSATAFPSMREATRAAMRLPSGLRAFGLPRAPEVDIKNRH